MNEDVQEFGRCWHCRKIRWHSKKAYERFGFRCITCGSPRWVPIKELSVIDRITTTSWTFWENWQYNHWTEFLNPYVLIRLAWSGFFPKIRIDQEIGDAGSAHQHS